MDKTAAFGILKMIATSLRRAAPVAKNTVPAASKAVHKIENIRRARHVNDRLLQEVYPELESLRATGKKGSDFVGEAKKIKDTKAIPIIEEAADSISGNMERMARKHPVGEYVVGQKRSPEQMARWEMFSRYGGQMGARNPYEVLDGVLKRVGKSSPDSAAFESGWRYFTPEWYKPMSMEEIENARKIKDILSF